MCHFHYSIGFKIECLKYPCERVVAITGATLANSCVDFYDLPGYFLHKLLIFRMNLKPAFSITRNDGLFKASIEEKMPIKN